MADLISREAALDVLVTSPNFHTTLTRIEELPTVDAIPVEWLKELLLSTDDDVDKVEFAWIMREWQEEQEG